ncbi:hypothetical protein BDR26DRAFT_869893 [Obelidium mucronatum]|nr:hypothetical protein BDR26DRAFT_869893 [Obelidium mucronatum]
MPGVIEVIIIMAIYNAVKKRLNQDGSKALVSATFPAELQAQIKGDFGGAAAAFARQTQRRAVRAAGAASAKKKAAGWFFARTEQDEKEDEREDDEQDEQLEDNDNDLERDRVRPGTPAPTPPSPVLLDEKEKEKPEKDQRPSVLARLSRLGFSSASSPPSPSSSSAGPTSPKSQQPQIKFDAAKATADAEAAILLLWAVSDALKKAKNARVALDKAKLSAHSDNESNTEKKPVNEGDSDTAQNDVQLQEVDDKEADAMIGKTDHERELQLLTSLNNESLVSLIRAIQAVVSLLKDSFLVAELEITYHDPIPLPLSSSLSSIVSAIDEDDSLLRQSVDSLDSVSTTTITATTNTKKKSSFPPLVHDTSKYPPALVSKLKLGWGTVGMILDCTTKQEIRDLLERTEKMNHEDENNEPAPVEDDSAAARRLFLVDTIVDILKERGTVASTEIDWI